VNYGFEEASLLEIATHCFRTGNKDFSSMHEFVKKLFGAGIISAEAVKEDLKRKNADVKLLAKMQELCGSIRPSSANLTLLGTWREWCFSDEMILEAAKRASGSASPVPYVNRILSDWKHAGYKTLTDLKKDEKPTSGKPTTGGMPSYVIASVEAANAKAEREKYYADKREKAQSVADRYVTKAKSEPKFGAIEKALSKMNMDLAKAEIFNPDELPVLKAKQAELLKNRANILKALGIEEWQLLPQYECKKCSDTGFMKSGKSCDCFNKNK
jgi:DnaD/phage-associated family protein